MVKVIDMGLEMYLEVVSSSDVMGRKIFVSSKYFHIKKYPTRTQVIRSIENDRNIA